MEIIIVLLLALAFNSFVKQGAKKGQKPEGPPHMGQRPVSLPYTSSRPAGQPSARQAPAPAPWYLPAQTRAARDGRDEPMSQEGSSERVTGPSWREPTQMEQHTEGFFSQDRMNGLARHSEYHRLEHVTLATQEQEGPPLDEDALACLEPGTWDLEHQEKLEQDFAQDIVRGFVFAEILQRRHKGVARR